MCKIIIVYSKMCAHGKSFSPFFIQFSRKDQGVYKAVLSDDRGKDTSVFDVSGQGTTSARQPITLSSTSSILVL